MSDRITGLIVSVLALAFFAGASQLEMPFFADPLGPKAFPMLIASVAFISGCVMVLRPDAEPDWPSLATFGRLLIAVLVLVLYAYGLKPLGFCSHRDCGWRNLLSDQANPQGGNSDRNLSVVWPVYHFQIWFGLSLFPLPRWLMG